MKVYKYFLVLCILFLLNEVSPVCKKYTCGNLEEGLCSSENIEENKIIIQKCANSSEFCPFMNNVDNQISCASRDGYHPRSFPGGRCQKNSECVNGTCQDGICGGKGQSDECKNPTECNRGLSCKNSIAGKTCQAQSIENEDCEDDFDCINSHGCYNGKCIAYLSLPLGASSSKSRNILSMCQSGLDYQGKCEILTNINFTCSDEFPCRYKLSNGSEAEINEFCLCGKNPTGTKTCRLGNGAQEFTDYIEELKTILHDTSNCNTVERGLCMSHFSSSKDLSRFLISRAKALRFHDLYNSDECVINLFSP